MMISILILAVILLSGCAGGDHAYLPQDGDIIFHNDSLCGDALLDHWPGRVGVNVVHCQHLNQWRGVHPISDGDTALTTQHVQFTNQPISSDVNKRVREVPKVVNV